MSNNSTKSQQAKISAFVLVAIYITLALSFVAIALGAVTYYTDSTKLMESLALFGIGIIALALAGYILFQTRKRVASLKIDAPPILTIIECRKCGIKSTREFQRGDFVYKELEKCPKCEDKQVITAIYREIKEKEKPVTV